MRALMTQKTPPQCTTDGHISPQKGKDSSAQKTHLCPLVGYHPCHSAQILRYPFPKCDDSLNKKGYLYHVFYH